MIRLNVENHELTKLENEDFAFGCFTIMDLETLSHWHTHNEIVYVHSSSKTELSSMEKSKVQPSCTIFINGQPIDCFEGEFVLVPHESLHAIIPKNSAQYSALIVGDSLLTHVMKDIHINQAMLPFFSTQPFSPIHVRHNQPSYDILVKHLCSIIEIYDAHLPFFEVSIKLELCHFFLSLFQQFPDLLQSQTQANTTARNVHLLKLSLDFMAQNYAHKITIDQLCHLSNLSNQHYSRLFKAYTGKTVVDYLNDMRLTQASFLLTTTDLPITHLPELTGFCNSNYFSRVFKDNYGCSPSQYRKKASAQQMRVGMTSQL